MGRSVITHPQATVVAYDTFEPDEVWYKELWNDAVEDGTVDPEEQDFEDYMWEQWQWDAADQWQDFKDWVQERIVELWPSMEESDRMVGSRYYDSENLVLAQNSHSEISISEYCGAVALSLAPRSDLDYYYSDERSMMSLGEQWRKSIADKFEERFGTMHRLGGFSDGTSVYQKSA